MSYPDFLLECSTHHLAITRKNWYFGVKCIKIGVWSMLIMNLLSWFDCDKNGYVVTMNFSAKSCVSHRCFLASCVLWHMETLFVLKKHQIMEYLDLIFLSRKVGSILETHRITIHVDKAIPFSCFPLIHSIIASLI